MTTSTFEDRQGSCANTLIAKLQMRPGKQASVINTALKRDPRVHSLLLSKMAANNKFIIVTHFAFLSILFQLIYPIASQLHEPLSLGVIDPLNKEIFRILTEPPFYQKHLPPQETRPICVLLSIYLIDIGSIHEATTSFDLHLLLRIAWIDERLRPWNVTINKNQSMAILEGATWHLDRLWTPDLHVPNSKLPNVLQDSSQNLVITRIQSDGQILVSKRLLLHGTSQMDFRLYPLDVQTIDIEIESNELSSSNLQLAWKEVDALRANSDFTWSGYQMYRYGLLTESTNYSITGTFSKLIARLYLRRDFGWDFTIEIYAPIIIFAVISWTGFWIDIKEAGARVALCMTTLLTLVTTARDARKSLPPVEYITMLDVWITTCMVFILASLAEYFAVNYLFWREKRAALKIRKRKKSAWERQKYLEAMAKLRETEKTVGLQTEEEKVDRLKREMVQNQIEADNDALDQQITSESKGESSTSKENDLQHSDQRMPKLQTLSPPTWSTLNDLPLSDYSKSNSHFSLRSLCCLSSFCSSPLDRVERKLQVDGSEEKAYEIDRIARFAFPIAFALFNIFYWTMVSLAVMRTE